MHGDGFSLTLAEEPHNAQRPKPDTIPKTLGYIVAMQDKTLKAAAERTPVGLGHIDVLAFFRKFLAIAIGSEISYDGRSFGGGKDIPIVDKTQGILATFFCSGFLRISQPNENTSFYFFLRKQPEIASECGANLGSSGEFVGKKGIW
jgi:hypothetical protein